MDLPVEDLEAIYRIYVEKFWQWHNMVCHEERKVALEQAAARYRGTVVEAAQIPQLLAQPDGVSLVYRVLLEDPRMVLNACCEAER